MLIARDSSHQVIAAITMRGDCTVSQVTPQSSSADGNVNPFESSEAYLSADDSTISYHVPTPVVPSPPPQRHMASAASARGQKAHSAGNSKEVLRGEQEKESKAIHQKRQRTTDRALRSHDPEKAADPSSNLNSHDASNVAHPANASSNHDNTQARNALKILLWLSGPCVLLSLITMIWAVFSLLLTILYQPLRFCTPRLLFGQQLSHLLAPTLNLHLRCIYAQTYPRPDDGAEMYSPLWLLAVQLVAPILSLGNAIAGCAIAIYWGLTRIVEDPSGADGKDDGVDAVLVLIRCWQGCLLKGVKN